MPTEYFVFLKRNLFVQQWENLGFFHYSFRAVESVFLHNALGGGRSVWPVSYDSFQNYLKFNVQMIAATIFTHPQNISTHKQREIDMCDSNALP